jgi:hypothetical protein
MNDSVKLAPPGAGLPALERLLSLAALRGLRALPGRATLSRWLRHETRITLALAARLPEAQAHQPVLVPRPTGLEDSSRHWSAGMVLQHLVIVTEGIHGIAQALADDAGFEREVRIAEVKPQPGAGPEQGPLLQAAVDRYLAQIDALPTLRTAARHAHPWFGPLDLHGWHALAAMHAFAHRRQLARIVASFG